MFYGSFCTRTYKFVLPFNDNSDDYCTNVTKRQQNLTRTMIKTGSWTINKDAIQLRYQLQERAGAVDPLDQLTGD